MYHEPYAIALGKLSDALEDKLKGDLRSKWKILKDKRKAEKRSRPDGRQLVVFVLQHLRCAQSGTPEALRSLMLLNAKRKTTPLTTDTMTSFLRTWDEIMLLDSANLISEGDKLSHLYEIVQTCKDPELRTPLAFYHEIATPDRIVELLYSTLETFLELHRERAESPAGESNCVKDRRILQLEARHSWKGSACS